MGNVWRFVKLNAIVSAATALAMFALFGSILALFRAGDLAAQREQDRIRVDLIACQNTNQFRGDVIQVAEAGAALDEAIIRSILGRSGNRTQAEIDAFILTLAPTFEEYQTALTDIQPIDCQGTIAP